MYVLAHFRGSTCPVRVHFICSHEMEYIGYPDKLLQTTTPQFTSRVESITELNVISTTVHLRISPSLNDFSIVVPGMPTSFSRIDPRSFGWSNKSTATNLGLSLVTRAKISVPISSGAVFSLCVWTTETVSFSIVRFPKTIENTDLFDSNVPAPGFNSWELAINCPGRTNPICYLVPKKIINGDSRFY